jgi:hypothetical protein
LSYANLPRVTPMPLARFDTPFEHPVGFSSHFYGGAGRNRTDE